MTKNLVNLSGIFNLIGIVSQNLKLHFTFTFESATIFTSPSRKIFTIVRRSPKTYFTRDS